MDTPNNTPESPTPDAGTPIPETPARFPRINALLDRGRDQWRAIRFQWDHRREREDRFQALLADFEEDYRVSYQPGVTKPPEVGRPYLLLPWRMRGGIVLTHGYMAAPLEVRALAEHLRRRGFAVYALRLKGHGTAPEDLSSRTWHDWYSSIEQAVQLMKAITPNIALVGFSMGGCLSLVAASRMADTIRAVVSICAPLYVRRQSIHFVPSIVGVNSLLKRFGVRRFQWDYIANHPENQHINYDRNPLTGARQLLEIMAETERSLSKITLPALVMQASKDPIVHPDSGPAIFSKIGSVHKELALLERSRHGIINGEGSDIVHRRVAQFLMEALQHKTTADPEPAVVSISDTPIPLSEVPAEPEPENTDTSLPISG